METNTLLLFVPYNTTAYVEIYAKFRLNILVRDTAALKGGEEMSVLILKKGS